MKLNLFKILWRFTGPNKKVFKISISENSSSIQVYCGASYPNGAFFARQIWTWRLLK